MRAFRWWSLTICRRQPRKDTMTLPANPYRVTGLSCVLHPWSPHIPTAHANIRCFVVGESETPLAAWVGGGMDLTPHLVYEQDIAGWHAAIRDTLDAHNQDWYSQFAENCNEYFSLPHRGGERRGVGGMFFDDLVLDQAQIERFFTDLVACFSQQWTSIARRRMSLAVSTAQRRFQLWRRGRYVEFNLLHDRGTKFGLQSGGRADSILVSMPPLAAWHYPQGGVSQRWRDMQARLEAALAKDWNKEHYD